MQRLIAYLEFIVTTPIVLVRVVIKHWWEHRNDNKPKKTIRW